MILILDNAYHFADQRSQVGIAYYIRRHSVDKASEWTDPDAAFNAAALESGHVYWLSHLYYANGAEHAHFFDACESGCRSEKLLQHVFDVGYS
jgi:hypothetical protein